MGTSRSSKQSIQGVASAFIFSGRPEPTWTVSPGMVQRLEAIWNSLEPRAKNPPSAPPLGYRGCFLRDAVDREWFAYCGVVTLKTATGSESREDKDRDFEKTLLRSAPEGKLPAVLLGND
jgi:hypothetical protein